VLNDIINFDKETYKLLISRIKLTSEMKLNVRDKAQDGRFSIKLKDEEIEVRSSLIPGAYSESTVLRILNPNTISVPLEELGINEKLLNIILQELKKPNGMILNTGPTGSGKTTTLYAFLKKIHTPDIKIITIENPIEYHVPGIVQTQTNDAEGYTFMEGLRSALRQDPDCIMIGEIRDDETAEIAVNAALTGHLVFSTLHTNNAAQTIDRIIDTFPGDAQNQVRLQLSNALLAIFSQRLIPRISGGLIPAYELLINNYAIGNLIRESRTSEITSVLETSAEEGMVSMNQSLADLVRRGEITQELAFKYSLNPEALQRRFT
jgi:pilus retraction protein PilT